MCNMLHWQCFLNVLFKCIVGIKILIPWLLLSLTLFIENFLAVVMMTTNSLEFSRQFSSAIDFDQSKVMPYSKFIPAKAHPK